MKFDDEMCTLLLTGEVACESSIINSVDQNSNMHNVSLTISYMKKRTIWIILINENQY